MPQVDEMTATLSAAEITQPVTFPVRAGIAAHSGVELQRLLDGTPDSTLTLWGSASDPVDVPALRDVLDLIGRQYVYIDVSEELRDALNFAAPSHLAAPALALASALTLHALW